MAIVADLQFNLAGVVVIHKKEAYHRTCTLLNR